jgi:hypothetical protein
MQAKRGDWYCDCCDNLCFASKTYCNNCGAKRTKYEKDGDWSCSCGELNFASRIHCRKCGDIKKVEESKVKFRDGDWYCSSCNELNFSSRSKCRKCSIVKDAKVIINEVTEKCSRSSLCSSCLEKIKSCDTCKDL